MRPSGGRGMGATFPAWMTVTAGSVAPGSARATVAAATAKGVAMTSGPAANAVMRAAGAASAATEAAAHVVREAGTPEAGRATVAAAKAKGVDTKCGAAANVRGTAKKKEAHARAATIPPADWARMTRSQRKNHRQNHNRRGAR